MRDFRDAKAMARTLRTALAAKGLKVGNSDSLELIAKALGARDWNTLSAMLHAEAAPPRGQAAPQADAPEPPPARPQSGTRGFAGFSPLLEQTLHRAVDLANRRRQPYATPEHLLLALADGPDAAAVLRACAIDLNLFRRELLRGLAAEPGAAGDDGGEQSAPSSAFQRIIQRAVIHVQSAGGDLVTGANVLIALFSERDGAAAKLLSAQGLTRFDAVNFVAHGIRKGDGNAAA
jgi:hypothetical protein